MRIKKTYVEKLAQKKELLLATENGLSESSRASDRVAEVVW